jgi:hypothetical protein
MPIWSWCFPHPSLLPEGEGTEPKAEGGFHARLGETHPRSKKDDPVSEERKYRRVISTQEELKDLVEKAIITGELDISNFKIDVDFYLAELLLACGQKKTPYKKPEEVPSSKKVDFPFTVECPFEIKASGACFSQNFITRNYSKMVSLSRKGLLPISADSIDSDSTVVLFSRKVECINALFKGKTEFRSAIFSSEAYFSSATFSSEAYFSSAIFSSEAYFASAIFTKEANFFQSFFSSKALFIDATFSGGTVFWATIFLSEVDFSRTASFGKAYFSLTCFSSKADFKNATFTEQADFSQSFFFSKAYFASVSFTEQADFKNVSFSGLADFESATFSERAIFHNASFSGLAEFRNATFAKYVSFKEIRILENSKLNFDHITTHDYFGIIPKVFNGKIVIDDPTLESDRRSLVLDFKDCYKDTGKATFKGVEIDNDRTCLKVRNLPTGSKVTVDFEKCGFYGKSVAFTDVYMKQVSITGGNYVSGMAFYHCEWVKYNPYYASFKWHYIFLDMFLMRGFTFRTYLHERHILLKRVQQ